MSICARCGHDEKDHRPPKQVDVSKSGGSSGKAVMKVVIATTHCYTNALCSCIAFVPEVTA